MSTLLPVPTHGLFRDLSGHTFGRLTVIGFAGRGTRGRTLWLCRCSCGKERVCQGGNLTTGNTKSCGCLLPFERKSPQRHGGTMTPEYMTWAQMKTRCLNPKDRHYHNYGGRGIKVCQRWVDSFEAFLADMGPRLSPAHTLDRFPDNNGNYEPGNCRWATMQQQERNRRNSIFIEINGVSRHLLEWVQEAGVSEYAVRHRYRKGVRGAALLSPVKR